MRKITKYCAVSTAVLGMMATASAQQPVRGAQPELAGPRANVELRNGDQVEGRQHLYRAASLMGAAIRNPQGQDLGNVKEMVVDPVDGMIRYAVVSYGGFLDIGDKLFAVPIQAMKIRRDEDGDAYFVVNIDQQRLENAKGFDDDNWPNFADRKFAQTTYQQYGVAMPEMNQAAASHTLYKLSTFDGTQVRDRTNSEIGDVDWTVLDPAQSRIAYYAVDVDNSDRTVMVPAGALELMTQGNDAFLQFNGDAELVRTSPATTPDKFMRNAQNAQWRPESDSRFEQSMRRAGRDTRDAGGAVIEGGGAAVRGAGRAVEGAGRATGRVLEGAGRAVERGVDSIIDR